MKKIPTPPPIWSIFLALFIVPLGGHAEANCAGHLNARWYTFSMAWEGQCYIYVESMPYCKPAFETCVKMGGTLVKMVSLKMQRHFFRKIANHQGEFLTDFWLGLRYDQNIDDWKWANGDPVTWTNWKTRPNKNNCVAVTDLEGTWVEHDETHFADGLICHIRTPSATMATPTTARTATRGTSSTLVTPTTGSPTSIIPITDSVNTMTHIRELTSQTTTESTTLEEKISLQRRPPVRKEHQITRRTVIFEAFRGRDEDLYVAEKPEAVEKVWSFLACCSKCTLLVNCSVINYNSKGRLCHLFASREVLQRVDQEPGWIVFVKNLVD